MTAYPRCNSARELSSDQSLSPVVIGRLTMAVTQSSVPAGLNETLPRMNAMRATRLGGSSSSAAARCGVMKQSAIAMLTRLVHFSSCFLMALISPEALAADVLPRHLTSYFKLGFTLGLPSLGQVAGVLFRA